MDTPKEFTDWTLGAAGRVRLLNYTVLVTDTGLLWRSGAVACRSSCELVVEHLVDERAD